MSLESDLQNQVIHQDFNCHTLVKVEVEVETRVGFIIRKKTTADAADAAATSGPLIFY